MQILDSSQFIARINHIVGTNAQQGSPANLGSGRGEGRAQLLQIRLMQKQLRLLKQELSAAISAIKSEFTTARARIGKGFGAGLVAGFFGRKTMGKANAFERDRLRREQIQAVGPYEHAKKEIDRLLAYFDQVKGHIELSSYAQAPRTVPSKNRDYPAGRSFIHAEPQDNSQQRRLTI